MDVPDRPHTGRRRNEAARRAILDAAVELAAAAGGHEVTVQAIAERSGVGKQTIYRWWHSKQEVLLDALTEYAAREVPAPQTGDPRADVTAFLRRTLSRAGRPEIAAALRTLAAEAQRDHRAADLLARFTAHRRATLTELLRRAGVAEAELMSEFAFGVLWYRILIAPGPLDEAAGRRVAEMLLGPAGESTRPG